MPLADVVFSHDAGVGVGAIISFLSRISARREAVAFAYIPAQTILRMESAIITSRSASPRAPSDRTGCSTDISP